MGYLLATQESCYFFLIYFFFYLLTTNPKSRNNSSFVKTLSLPIRISSAAGLLLIYFLKCYLLTTQLGFSCIFALAFIFILALTICLLTSSWSVILWLLLRAVSHFMFSISQAAFFYLGLHLSCSLLLFYSSSWSARASCFICFISQPSHLSVS